MSLKPQISVVMSVYNSESNLVLTIDSIRNQSFKNFEFIIINDGSTDNSLEIINKYAALDPRIKLINRKENIGLTKSLNQGIKLARGKYIARQDAGDLSKLQRFKKQYEFLEKNNDIFLSGTNYDYIDEQGQIVNHRSNIPFLFKTIKAILPSKNCFIHTSIMFRNKEIFYREKFYYSQDYDLYLNLLTQGKQLINLKERLVQWTVNDSAISYIARNKQQLFADKAKIFFIQRIKYGKDDYYRFDSSSILKRKTIQPAQVVIFEERLLYYLKNRNYKKAKEIYQERYKNLSGVKWNKRIIFFIIINLPIIYQVYCKFFYNKIN